MASILWTAPKTEMVSEVLNWAPGKLWVAGRPQRLFPGQWVYVSHRGIVLYRARFEKVVSVYKGTTGRQGPALKVGMREEAPKHIPDKRKYKHGFIYLRHELW